jgi:phosphate-selective porin OprO/OprP
LTFNVRFYPMKMTSLGLQLAVLLPALAVCCGSARADDDTGWQAEYGKNGLEITSPGAGWIFEPEIRLQFRYADPFEEPRSAAAAREHRDGDFDLNRSRFKMEAQLGSEALTFYTEAELNNPVLLDLRMAWQPAETFGFQAGQWKPEYTRERRDSSGGQTFVDRSIVNREFTIDRQQGVMLFGRVKGGGAADFNWWTGMFGGGGRGSGNDGGDPMLMARWQWNPFGRVLGFAQSDIGRRARPAGSIAIAAAQNRSRYTRFSTDGGGDLDGFERGVDDQYEIRQWAIETALQWRGFSWQQEWHRKEVEDRVAGSETELEGLYAQASWFPGAAWSGWPKPLEFGVRYATVDPDTSEPGDRREEWTVGANWFFQGHRNKLTLDYGKLDFTEPGGVATAWRTRLQWDVSF